MTSASLAAPKKILVRSPNWIGDQVLAYPFFYWLRRTYPHARITAACVSWVKSVQFMDCVDEVLVLPRAKGKGFLSRVSARTSSETLGSLRAFRFCGLFPRWKDSSTVANQCKTRSPVCEQGYVVCQLVLHRNLRKARLGDRVVRGKPSIQPRNQSTPGTGGGVRRCDTAVGVTA